MVGFINTQEISEGILCICSENASGSVNIGIGIVFVSSGSNVVGDMEVKEIGEVVVEEESNTMTGPVGEEEARWTKISTMGWEVANIA